ncbi:alpha/beta hydrolase [Chitinimonas sp.]|uniref:alpha/beta fold hydrolase n=1 Tax=Chitinimonas sp. TaxID=1934313 RepID=UPI002F94D2AB
MTEPHHARRRFLAGATASLAGLALAQLPKAAAASAPIRPAAQPPLSIKQVQTDVLDIGYHEAGPEDGRPILLLHGYPYDIHSYAAVIPRLAAQGYRVVVPYLRAHGSTRFLNAATPRLAEQAALGQDVIDLMDALHIPEAVLAGFGWGGIAACAAAALRPSRCVGLLTVNGYLLDDPAQPGPAQPADFEARRWQRYYLATEQGRSGLLADRVALARRNWLAQSPHSRFDAALFEHSAQALDNPDHVDVVINTHRYQLGLAAGQADYANKAAKLALLPPITAPAITLAGSLDGTVADPGSAPPAGRFTGPHRHQRLEGVGHVVPQEVPKVFAAAVTALVQQGKWRS